jgi:outer membrane lipoprotein-sorting protein
MSRRPALAAFTLPVLLLFLPASAMAAPRDDLFEAWQKFLALKSFRATITGVEPARPGTRLEFQAPDRYRISIANGPTTTLIGDVATMTVGGRTMTLPVPVKSMTAQYRDEAFLKKLQEGMEVEDLGGGTLDGEKVRKLRYVQDVEPPMVPGAPTAAAGSASKATTVAWISAASGLILKLEVSSTYSGEPTKTEIRYSGFDDPTIVIAPPGAAAATPKAK